MSERKKIRKVFLFLETEEYMGNSRGCTADHFSLSLAGKTFFFA